LHRYWIDVVCLWVVWLRRVAFACSVRRRRLFFQFGEFGLVQFDVGAEFLGVRFQGLHLRFELFDLGLQARQAGVDLGFRVAQLGFQRAQFFGGRLGLIFGFAEKPVHQGGLTCHLFRLLL